MLILSKADLYNLLTMAEVIQAVEQGFHLLAKGKAFAPERLSMAIPASNGVLLEMPSLAGGESPQSFFGSKLVTVFPQNPARGLEMVQAAYLLFDGENGAPLALLDAKYITAIRTAATSAVATKYLSNLGKKRLAIFGAGVQARFHIAAMREVAEIESINIASRTAAKAQALAQETSATYRIKCEVMTAEEAASQANLLCACTSSASPLFDGNLLQDGTHINAVGTFTPTTRELDSSTIQRASVFIDAASAAGKEAGDILIPLAEGAIDRSHIKGTLADLVTGKDAGRCSESEITVFKSCGHAIEDLMTAQLAYTKAVMKGTGVTVDL
jgi:ornithine cyclodeaminase/alanine dehydrogenase-like protein (mu-crystallin family)